MEMHRITMKLVGPVTAVGETNEDGRRLTNLRELTELIDCLLFEVSEAARTADRPEASMKEIGQHAKQFLESVRHA